MNNPKLFFDFQFLAYKGMNFFLVMMPFQS